MLKYIGLLNVNINLCKNIFEFEYRFMLKYFIKYNLR